MSLSARAGWSLFGLLVLLASGIGVYFSTRPAGKPAPAPDSGLVFRTHATPAAMPPLEFQDGRGDRRTLEQFRGRAVLLNIWATWCAPCREEMPALDRLQQKLGGPGFEVVALSIDASGAAAVKRFYDEMGIRSLAIYVDPSMRATATLRALGVPTTLLIDAEGREVGRRTGPAEWDSAEAVRMITGYMQ